MQIEEPFSILPIEDILYEVQSETAALTERQDAVTDILRAGGIMCAPRSTFGAACGACGTPAGAGGGGWSVSSNGSINSGGGGSSNLGSGSGSRAGSRAGSIDGGEGGDAPSLPVRPESPIIGDAAVARTGR